MLSLSHVRLFVTLWTVTRQTPLSMEFSMQKYWSGFPFPSPGDFPNPGIKPVSPASPALAGRLPTTAPQGPRKITDPFHSLQGCLERKTSDADKRVTNKSALSLLNHVLKASLDCT